MATKKKMVKDGTDAGGYVDGEVVKIHGVTYRYSGAQAALTQQVGDEFRKEVLYSSAPTHIFRMVDGRWRIEKTSSRTPIQSFEAFCRRNRKLVVAELQRIVKAHKAELRNYQKIVKAHEAELIAIDNMSVKRGKKNG